jgi:hypothetical protein
LVKNIANIDVSKTIHRIITNVAIKMVNTVDVVQATNAKTKILFRKFPDKESLMGGHFATEYCNLGKFVVSTEFQTSI